MPSIRMGLAAAVAASALCSAVPSEAAEPAAEAIQNRACGVLHAAYDHPSMACWSVFESSLTRGDYAAAFEAVRVGCDRYKRGDHCLFLRKWNTTAEEIRSGRTPAERYRIRVAAERAADLITTSEVEDAEAPLHARALESFLHKSGQHGHKRSESLRTTARAVQATHSGR